MDRLKILGVLDAGRPDEYVAGKISLKEQLREIEKAMVILGWNGKAHIVKMTSRGPVLTYQTQKTGHVIMVKRFNTRAHVNKYI